MISPSLNSLMGGSLPLLSGVDATGRVRDSDHQIRVLLARICEHVNRNATKSVLVHIRRGPEILEVNGHERELDQ